MTPIRALLRRRKGRCVVCGGPYPDGSGCEFCPAVDELELEREGVREQRDDDVGSRLAVELEQTSIVRRRNGPGRQFHFDKKGIAQ